MSGPRNDDGSDTPPPLHVYDDIEEQDNRLPNWWLGLLYGSILFAFSYWFVYEVARLRTGPWQAYEVQAAAAAKLAEAAPLNDQVLLTLAADRRATGEAARLFGQMCAPCHGANAQGLVGPNLTDRFWLHGGGPTAIHASINGGYPKKGMPQWGKMLGAARVRSLAAYIISLKGKNLPGKEPQGKEEE